VYKKDLLAAVRKASTCITSLANKSILNYQDAQNCKESRIFDYWVRRPEPAVRANRLVASTTLW